MRKYLVAKAALATANRPEGKKEMKAASLGKWGVDLIIDEQVLT